RLASHRCFRADEVHMSRFTDHAERFERRHPRDVRALAVAILVAAALLAVAVDSVMKSFGIQ
ncbi:hypothetical protein, partial [Klebsiella pneumoniae]|uniref:hypothetical protein n=1 Tax=Klebsiella pneumoniae TaxID=573 RepID=UPI00300506D7